MNTTWLSDSPVDDVLAMHVLERGYDLGGVELGAGLVKRPQLPDPREQLTVLGIAQHKVWIAGSNQIMSSYTTLT